MSKKEKVSLERKDIVLAVKDMNKTLALNPPIATKKGDAFVPEASLIESIKKYAKGFDDETGKYDKSQAVSKDNCKLTDATWKVLEALGAVDAPVVSKKASKDKPEKAVKFADKKPDKIATPKDKKAGGRLLKDFKSLKKQLEESDSNLSLARSFDKILMKKQTLGESMKEAEAVMKKMGVQRSFTAHIKWRMEQSGWVFKDTRKHQSDLNGVLCCVDVDPTRCGTYKCELPLRSQACKPSKKEEKPVKVEKKADKTEVKKAKKSAK